MFELVREILLGCVGLALLCFGADFLVRGGASLAARMRISSLVIGLTLVAFGTSAPELVVSLGAALKQMGDISLGNVVGSNICNIALILGLSALITPLPVNPKLFRLDLPLLLTASLFVAAVSFFFQGIPRLFGIVLTTGILAYTIWSIRLSRRETQEGTEDDAKIFSVPLSLLFVVLGILGLVAGARFFLGTAVFLAKMMHVSDAVIGLTVVAVGTSLPELATSIVAALRGENDIAVGNVVGSNLFNLLAILGVTACVSPISAPQIQWIDICVMLAVTFALYPILWKGRVVGRPAGALLLFSYLGYMAWLVVGVVG